MKTTNATVPVIELLGDGISSELSASVHAVAAALPFRVDFQPVDLSLATRSQRGDAVFDECVELLATTGVGLKYPTATEGVSPNRVLRERCNFSVIHRPVRTIPGIPTNFTQRVDLDIVRVATGGTYEDSGRRLGLDSAVSLRVIERRPSQDAARFAFELARARGSHVVSTSKYTIQAAADGLFEEAVEQISRGYPTLPYRRELFDALLAGVILHPERYRVIVCPNEYGDFLSDMACGLIGSIGMGDSASYAFDEEGEITLALFDPSGGSAPDIAGQGICNPSAALLALASLLRHVGEEPAARALVESLHGCIADGERTRDIGGALDTAAFTAAVLRRLEPALVAV